ncbi:hypothetical protein NESM_000560100 [Novymonas esmeraldas]|uniref:Uncharacterized protein n=1 Tax=Novymonas esmeraldas TaxID=1808958 RepID=A0AAW0ERB4_9TRYP
MLATAGHTVAAPPHDSPAETSTSGDGGGAAAAPAMMVSDIDVLIHHAHRTHRAAQKTLRLHEDIAVLPSCAFRISGAPHT